MKRDSLIAAGYVELPNGEWQKPKQLAAECGSLDPSSSANTHRASEHSAVAINP